MPCLCGGIALDSLSHHRHEGGVVVCHNHLREVSMIAVVAISVREWKCIMVDLNKDHNQIHIPVLGRPAGLDTSPDDTLN